MANSKVNQNCFNCASFQPYIDKPLVTTKNGECRWCPQVGELTVPTGDPGPTTFNQFWPYIDDGLDFWCSKWKLTGQEAVVPSANPVAPVWPGDWEAFQAAPWNRRASLNQSCWNCNHYQYEVDPPVNPGENTGQCRKGPPPPVLDLVVGITSETLEPGKFIYAGSAHFCSAWEMKEGTIPTDPGPAQ